MRRTDDSREAASILRGLKDRLDRVEQAVNPGGTPNILRIVDDRVGLLDAVNARVNDAEATDVVAATDTVAAREGDASAADTAATDDDVTTTAYVGGEFVADTSSADSNDRVA